MLSSIQFIKLKVAPDDEKYFHTFAHCLVWQWGHQTAQKWRTAEDKNRSNTIRSNVSSVFCLWPAKDAKNVLFATYSCFIRRNKLSPASRRVCSSQGKNCHCSIFCRDRAHSWPEPALPAGTTLPASLPGWDTGSGAGAEGLPPGRSAVILPPARHSLPAGPAGCWESPGSWGVPGTRLGWGVTPAPPAPPGERWAVSSREASLSSEGDGVLEHRHSSIQTSEGNSAKLNKQIEAQREEKLHLSDLLLFFMCTFDT